MTRDIIDQIIDMSIEELNFEFAHYYEKEQRYGLNEDEIEKKQFILNRIHELKRIL